MGGDKFSPLPGKKKPRGFCPTGFFLDDFFGGLGSRGV